MRAHKDVRLNDTAHGYASQETTFRSWLSPTVGSTNQMWVVRFVQQMLYLLRYTVSHTSTF